MTKTLKKGLLAVLMLLMAAVIGVAAFAVFRTAKAADDGRYDKFQTYMGRFDKTLDALKTKYADGELEINGWTEDSKSQVWTEELIFPNVKENPDYLLKDLLLELFGEEIKDNEKNVEPIEFLWQTYISAQWIYEDSETVKSQLDRSAVSTYSTINEFFAEKLNDIVLVATTDMTKIAQSNSYIWHEKVENLTEEINDLEENAYAKYEYVYYATNGLRQYQNSVELMADLEETMLKVIDAIKAIRYYDTEAEEMVEEGYTAAENQEIVLGTAGTEDNGSIDSIMAVHKELVETDVVNRNWKLRASDYQFITGLLTEDEEDDDVNYYEDYYLTALKQYNEQLDKIEAVKALIEDLYLDLELDAEVDGLDKSNHYCDEENESFYIYILYIEDAEAAFEALQSDDYNNLQSYLTVEGAEYAYAKVYNTSSRHPINTREYIDFVTHGFEETIVNEIGEEAITYSEALTYLTDYIANIDEMIATIVEAIKNLPEAEFDNAEYVKALNTITVMLFGTENARYQLFKTTANITEAEYDEDAVADIHIPADVLAHDDAVYNEMLAEFYANGYGIDAVNYIDELHQIYGYIIGSYEDYVKAYEQYAGWIAKIDELLDLLNDLIDKHFSGENIATDIGEYESKYNELTPAQKKYFDELHVNWPDPTGSLEYDEQHAHWLEHKKDAECEGDCEYLVEDGVSTTDAYDWIKDQVNDFKSAVKDLNDAIEAIYRDTVLKDLCAYGYYDEILELVEKYYEIEDATTRAYVTSADHLWEMFIEVTAEQGSIDAWVAAVDEIKDYAEDLDIREVWKSVEAAQAAYNAVRHYAVNFTEAAYDEERNFLLEESTYEANPVEDDETLHNVLAGIGTKDNEPHESYETYMAAVDAMEASKALVAEAAQLMAKIDTILNNVKIDLSDDADHAANIEALQAWLDDYNAATAKLKEVEESEYLGAYTYVTDLENEDVVMALKDGKVTNEAYTNGEDSWNNQEWTFGEAYENYLLKAEKLNDQYTLEKEIEELLEMCEEDGVYAHMDKIQEVKDHRDEFNAKYADEEEYTDTTWAEEEVRNNDKLDALLEELAELTEELDAWIAAVHALCDDVKESGYPFNIYTVKDMELDEEGTVWAELDEHSFWTLIAWYLELTENATLEAEVGFLSTEFELLNTTLEASKAAIDKLNEDIADFNAMFYEEVKDEEGEEVIGYVIVGIPSGDDLDIINDILERYNAFHQSQRDKLNQEEVDKFFDLLDLLEVPDGFEDMLQELYKQAVLEGDVTNYTPFYLEVVRTLYSDLNEAVKAIYKVTVEVDGEEQELLIEDVLDLIQEAIDAVLEEKGYLPSLKEAYEKLAELEEALKNATDADLVKELQTAVDELQSALSDAESKLADLEATVEGLKSTSATLDQLNSKVEELDAQLKAYIAEAIQQAKDELQGNIDELEGKVEELQKALEAADGELKAQIEKAIEDLNAAIASAKGELEAADLVLDGKITALSEALETAKTNLDNAINDLKSELTNAMNDLKSELEGKINEAKEELEGEIAGLQTKIDGVEKALNDLAADAATKAELEAAKTELQNKLTEAQNKIAALEEAVKNLEAKDVELAGLITGLTNDLAAAKAELKQEIENLESKLNKAITDAVDAAKKELNDKIDSVESELKDLIGTESVADQIAKAKEDIANEIAKALEDAFSDISGFATLGETLAAAFSEYNANITAAYTEAINEAVAELEAKLTGLDSSVDETFADIQAQIDAIKDILGSVTSLDDLDAAVKNLTKAQADLEKAIKDLEAKMNAADADLQAQIDALSSKTTTMLVLVIVLAVVLVAAIVCIILLFIKRKNA